MHKIIKFKYRGREGYFVQMAKTFGANGEINDAVMIKSGDTIYVVDVEDFLENAEKIQPFKNIPDLGEFDPNKAPECIVPTYKLGATGKF